MKVCIGGNVIVIDLGKNSTHNCLRHQGRMVEQV